jgi:hypothetical protein
MRTVVIGFAVLVASGAREPAVGAGPDFERDVAPLVIRRCLECHGEATRSGGLVLTSGDRLRAGGDSGAVVVQPGKPDESLLLQRVLAGEMPPEKHGKSQQLPKTEQETLRAWIAAGAEWPAGRVLDPYECTTDVRAGRDWWSLQPVVRPDIPQVRAAAGVRNPIDAFVLAKLEQHGWSPAPPAGRATVIRRLSLDLTGLPPTAEETEAFVRDESADAYERLVDRLLASPHLGERWARHWLDLVRYADTCGYERDQEKPGVWKYRDWVVRSFNDDKPYDRFVTEQLAGDELADRSEETVVATAFLRLGTWNDEPNDPDEYKYERLEDMVHATSTAFLALTVKCARCHDHKFDPVPQADYYGVANAFWAGFIEPGERALLGGPGAKDLGYDVFGWTDRAREPPPLSLLKNGDSKHPGPVVGPGHLSLIPALHRPVAPPPVGAATSHRRLQLAEWITDPQHPLTARVLVNRLWLHHFGQGLVRTPDDFGFNGERPTHPELLDWLADELVRPTEAGTVSGASDVPSQPWTLKRMHKLLVMSATYRQSSDHPLNAVYGREDAGNRLWWRAERRRLDADSLRDALLAASGQLDLRMGGPGFRPTVSAEALEGLSRKEGAWQASPPEDQRRRSLYLFLQRSLLTPFMTTFDQGDTTLPCGQRNVTTVAPQALALLNSEFVHEQSRALAGRVAADAGDQDEDRVVSAWRRVLGRDPTPAERDSSQEHLRRQEQRFADADQPRQRALESLSHVLLNTNEFLYVD